MLAGGLAGNRILERESKGMRAREFARHGALDHSALLLLVEQLSGRRRD